MHAPCHAYIPIDLGSGVAEWLVVRLNGPHTESLSLFSISAIESIASIYVCARHVQHTTHNPPPHPQSNLKAPTPQVQCWSLYSFLQLSIHHSNLRLLCLRKSSPCNQSRHLASFFHLFFLLLWSKDLMRQAIESNGPINHPSDNQVETRLLLRLVLDIMKSTSEIFLH